MSGDGTRRVIDALRDALVDGATEVHARTSPQTQAHRVEAERAHLDRMEDEVAPHVAAIRDALATGDTADALAGLLAAGAEPQHAGQLFSLLNNIILAFVFQVMGSLVPPTLQDAVNDQWSRFQSVPLSAEASALNVLRGYSSQAQGAAEAALSGVSPERFGQLLENTGEPPAIGEMLLLYRRGQASLDDLDRAIRQSRIRPEWIPFVHDLRYAPPGAGEVIAAAVEGHLDPADAAARIGEAGIDPANYQWLYDTAGRPPGAQELIGLLRRGLIGEDVVRQAIRESNIKNKYVDAIIQTRTHIPPMRTAISLVRKGIATQAEGTKWLLDLGFDPDVAAKMISEASTDTTATAKQLSMSQVLTGYKDGLLSAGDVTAHITALGHPAADAAFLLSVADYQRAHEGLGQAVGVVRANYVSHRVDDGTANADLSRLGLDGASITHLMGMWTVERDETHASLTQPQTSAMFKKELITEADYRDRLDKLGYAPVDVGLLVQLNHPTTEGAAV